MRWPSSPTVALCVGALGSGAANLAWTAPHGWVRGTAGVFATLLVPVAIHLWPRVPITGWITRTLRAMAMGYICAAAAVVNLAHAVMLLTAAPNPPAEHLVLAVLLITAVEAVMVMASLARRAPVRPQVSAAARPVVRKPAAAGTPKTPAGAVAPSPVPAGLPVTPVAEPEPGPPSELAAKRAETGEAKAWARANWPVKAKDIQDATGCSKGYSHKVRNALAEELGVAS